MELTRAVDLGFVVIANAVNLLIAAIFLSRPARMSRIEEILGLITVGLAVPVSLGIMLNAVSGRERWATILPAVLLLYLLVELLLDYILHVDFRHSRLLWPYLILFYAAVNAMTGYSFLVGSAYGYTTLTTYVLCLLATWYSYRAVGHGARR